MAGGLRPPDPPQTHGTIHDRFSLKRGHAATFAPNWATLCRLLQEMQPVSIIGVGPIPPGQTLIDDLIQGHMILKELSRAEGAQKFPLCTVLFFFYTQNYSLHEAQMAVKHQSFDNLKHRCIFCLKPIKHLHIFENSL